jgi:branched-chain amino acid transport system substrate-binding protein
MEGLGEKGKGLVVKTATYEVTDPTVDSQIVTLQSSGADTFFNITTPKFAAQAIRKVADIGWKPVHYLNQVSASVGSVLKPAGLDKSVGLVSMQYIKDPTDTRWASDKAMQDYFAFMKKNLPELDPMDGNCTYAMAVAQLTVQLLKQCGNNLTRDNVMKQAASIKGFQIPIALPGVVADTGPNDYAMFQTMQLVKFDGKTWQGFGEPVAVR